jgi:hypothetical protein
LIGNKMKCHYSATVSPNSLVSGSRFFLNQFSRFSVKLPACPQTAFPYYQLDHPLFVTN